MTRGSSRLREREGEVVHRADEVRRHEAARRGRVRRRRSVRASRPRPRRPRATRPGCSDSAAAKRGGVIGDPRLPELDAEPDQADHRPAATRRSDRRARRATLLDGHRHLRHRQSGAVGPQHELGVEEVGAVAQQRSHDRRRPSRAASPSCRACRTPAARSRTAQRRREPGGDRAAGPRAGCRVVPGARFDPTTMAGPSAVVRRREHPVDEVGDRSSRRRRRPRRRRVRGEDPVPHRLAVVGTGPGEHPTTLGRRPRRRGRRRASCRSSRSRPPASRRPGRGRAARSTSTFSVWSRNPASL